MLFVPSGLTLYIFVNNLLSIGQQQLVNRMQDRGAKA
jgi:membrane protein insertase Oxa1/YidC/SpoIIIJ